MTVAEIMTTKVITVTMDDTLDHIRTILERYHCHHIPVVEDNRLAGIVSDRDVLMALSPYVDTVGADNQALNTLKRKAHQIMTRRVITISPEDTVEEAATMMLERKFSCLPVLERMGVVVGIITKTDVLKSVFGKKARLLDLPPSDNPAWTAHLTVCPVQTNTACWHRHQSRYPGSAAGEKTERQHMIPFL